MRALLLIGACVAGVALVLGFTLFGGTSAKAAKPTLRVVGSAPIKVRGDHFRPDESVRVTNGKRSLRTRANGDGFFVVTIPASDRCNTTRVLARGTAGSYAVVKLLPAPMCIPARSG
jgi:hypothetical protein